MKPRDWFILVGLVVCTIAVYAQAARFEFVYYDDDHYVFNNPQVLRGPSAEGFRWAFTTFHVANWHPITWLSLMLDARFARANPFVTGGVDAGWFHIVNVALHAANAIVLFLALRAMTGASWRSGFVAALFALHPLHVESVAWVSERKDVLSTLFALLAILAYVRYARAPRGERGAGGTRGTAIGAYLAMLGMFILSLMSKPMYVTLPFVLLLLDYWPLARIGAVRVSRLILEKVPLLVLVAISSLVTLAAQRAGGAVRALEAVPLNRRLANAAVSYAQYLLDMVWPSGLAVLYPLPSHYPMATILAASAVLLLITLAAILLARQMPHLIVGWLWYVGMLVPVIGIVAVGDAARADRYTYLPLVGVFIMIAWSVPVMRSIAARGAIALLVACVLLALSVQTWRQTRHWRDSEALFTHALAVIGPNATMHLHWGLALAERRDLAGAERQYRAAQSARPEWPLPWVNLGALQLQQQRFTDAEQSFRKSIEIEPRYAPGHFNLAIALAQQGRLDEAETAVLEALRLQPGFPNGDATLAQIRRLRQAQR